MLVEKIPKIDSLECCFWRFQSILLHILGLVQVFDKKSSLTQTTYKHEITNQWRRLVHHYTHKSMTKTYPPLFTQIQSLSISSSLRPSLILKLFSTRFKIMGQTSLSKSLISLSCCLLGFVGVTVGVLFRAFSSIAIMKL